MSGSYRRSLILIVFIVGCGFVRSRVESAPTLPPELTALDAQFLALQAERVTGPFDNAVKKLNAAYLDRVTKMIAEQKAAGNLDGIIAFDEEQAFIASEQTIPEKDDEKTPPALKEMRGIYREAHAKLVATRVENLQVLIDPLGKRLAQMESDLAKADRIADAKVVRSYREALGEVGEGAPARTETMGADKNVRAPVMPASTLALKDGVVNSLGMKLLPVKGTDVLFCIHEVRYKDYSAYAAENASAVGSWKDQSADGFTPTDRNEDHPVIKVNWDDAEKFCTWLSKKEGKLYRLPTDQEWSVAVGIGRDEKWRSDTTPATVFKDQAEFPWGKEWPPAKGGGNYSDMSRHAKAPGDNRPWLEGHDDTFPTTAPVMSFEPNKAGLYDMGGNVWEWVEDFYDDAKKDRVLRGASWYDIASSHLLSSTRHRCAPDIRHYDRGFRVVLVLSRG